MISFLQRISLLFVILTVAVASCTERIDIPKIGDAPVHIVIYGYITSDTVQHSINITRSAGYFSSDSPEGVSDAIVTITDSDGKIISFAENDTVPGLYQTPEDYGEMGKFYTLNVHVDIDGTPAHYQSDRVYLQPIHNIDSISLRRAPPPMPRHLVELRLWAENFAEDNTYTIFVKINDSIVNSSINRFMVISDAMFIGTYIAGVGCYYLNQREQEHRNERLNIGDTVTLNMNAISKEYAAFIDNVRSEIRGSNPIFGGPPANVPTNIRRISANGYPALGFFTAFPSRYSSTIVKEDFTYID